MAALRSCRWVESEQDGPQQRNVSGRERHTETAMAGWGEDSNLGIAVDMLDNARAFAHMLTQKFASLLRWYNEGSRSDGKLSTGTTSLCAAGEDPYRHV